MKRRRRRRPHISKIPMDLVMGEILTRLPAKSLMRFKCVSKLWSSLIRSQYFTHRFFTVSSQPRPRFYICLADLANNYSTVISAPQTSSCFVVDHDLTAPRRGGYIWQNLRGFMCYTFYRKPRIYNPATRQLVTLPTFKSKFIPPAPSERVEAVYYYFGHDPVNDQYKVICSIAPKHNQIMPEHWVFVLKPRGSWKKMAPPDFCPHIPAATRRGLSINGVIYYLVLIDLYVYAVVSFDIRSEEFKLILVPRRDEDDLIPGRVKKVSLMEYDGKVIVLDFSHLTDKGVLDLWVLENAGNKEWSRKTLVLQPSQLHLVDNLTFKVGCTTQHGKVFFAPYDLISPFHILCYDLPRNDMTKIEIKGIPDHWFSKDKANTRFQLMFMDQGESILYLDI
ncbi:unnamed protein product [Eruca vesicaria subsp. sativa]|uniref:F-box domain-containing protein n=1 Tax=Eruca vesicaria subsp. sativa TaxID=29727 RepID=A0ABC8M7H9_ERUVS|nr:unnamed protein product [Eruca vesicaria subsp. sativa]